MTKQIVTYDAEPGTFSGSEAKESIRYRMLNDHEWNVLKIFYNNQCEVENYSGQPPAQVVNLIAQFKLNNDVKDIIIAQQELFPKEAALFVGTPKKSYGIINHLVARWSLDPEHELISLESIRETVKQKAITRRRELLRAGLETVATDAENFIANGSKSYISFD